MSVVTESRLFCDISHDKIYRIYSSSGTFFLPLFVMTFVYIRIYLETKRRLQERSKQVNKLALSVAKSVKKVPQVKKDSSQKSKL